jgi:predicted small lipoprotein YifL
MKKVFALAFVAAMVTLASCGEKKAEATADSATVDSAAAAAPADSAAADTAAADTAAAK